MSQNNSRPVRVVEVKASDLTASGEVFCPSPVAGMQLWNSHPRVYLNVAQSGRVKCPYCGTEYQLAPGEAVAHGH